MSEQVLADVKRDGTTIFSGIPLEINLESQIEQVGYGGTKPYYRHLCIMQQVLDIRQNDYLVNIRRIDPMSQQLTAWLDSGGTANSIHVATRPERLGDHIEFRGDDARTTGFS